MTSTVYIAQCEHRIVRDPGLSWGLSSITGAVDTVALAYILSDDRDPAHSASLQRRYPSRGHSLPSKPLPDSLENWVSRFGQPWKSSLVTFTRP